MMRRHFRRRGRLRNTRPQLFPVTNECERDQRFSWIHSALVLRECRSHKFFIPPPPANWWCKSARDPKSLGGDGMMFVMASSRISCLGAHMGEVVQFIPKRDLERVRLIQEARAIYERIFPPQAPARLQSGNRVHDESE